MPEEKLSTKEENAQHSPSAAPSLRDKRSTPEGVVPKQAQAYVVAGLAILILLAALFSKNHAKPAPATLPSQPPPATETNARKIEELKESLSAEQIQAKQQSQALSQRTNSGIDLNLHNPAFPQSGQTPAAQLPPSQSPLPEARRNPVEAAERELAFKSRFASNLIASSSTPRVDSTQRDADREEQPSVSTPAARSSSLPAPLDSSQTKRKAEININAAKGQPYVLFEGTTIDAVLVNRLDGEFVGPVKVMVSSPVYSHDGQHILIPEGSFLLGEAQRVEGFGQKRLSVAFHRMLMPDGYSVDLDQVHALDQSGATGLKGKINNHYMQIFGASIALGVIAGAAESTTNSGYNESGSDAYRQGVAASLSQSGMNALDKFLGVRPTHTIFEGHRVKIYLTQDMLFPAYENHSMPEVF